MPEARDAIEALQSHYRTGTNDLLGEFFEPCLRHCSSYDRAAGYFRSSALTTWCGILPRIASGADAGIRLLISPDLSDEDHAALVAVASASDRFVIQQGISDAFIEGVLSLEMGELPKDVRLQLLAWLIANSRLEIRFAFPEHVNDPGIYHEKIGVFEFPWGERVAFTGSANETLSGHRRNWESVDVYRSWVPHERERVDAKQDQFDEAWCGNAPGLDVVGLSLEVLARIRAISPTSSPTVEPPAAPSEGLRLHDHQELALNAWRSNGRTGLLEMCTGSGKTITALEAMTWLSQQPPRDEQFGTIAIVACPTKVLVDQWYTEIAHWRPDWLRLKVYDSISKWAPDLRVWLDHVKPRVFAVVGTYDSLLTKAFLSQLNRSDLSRGHSIFVADEAHHLGTQSRLDAAEEILPAFEANMALTATPEIEGYPPRTRRLVNSFSGKVFDFTLQQAIEAGVLCPYNYYPRPAFLDADASAEYIAISTELESAADKRQIELYRRKRELLRRSGVYLAEFERLLDELIASDKPLTHTVVYSPPGREEADNERIIEKIYGALSSRHISVASITAATPQRDRADVLSGFKNQKFEVLLGIGCLDEGLDVPETKRSIILYSFDRMKQFIQRRGRVLRRAPGKQAAEIYDLIQLPQGSSLPSTDRERILERELRRYHEFASGALNPEEAAASLRRAIEMIA